MVNKRKRERYLKQQKLRRKRGLDAGIRELSETLVIHWAKEELVNDEPAEAQSDA